MQEDVIYAILSVVEEIPEGKVATYGQIARLIGPGAQRPPGGKGTRPGGVLWDLSLPSGGESRGASGARLAGTEGIAGSRRRCAAG